jgi:hypothetical protein
MNRNQETFQALEALYQDNAVRDRKYYPDFRRSWNALLQPASESNEEYFPPYAESVVVIRSDYGGLAYDFHFNQSKIADWYAQEVSRGKRIVFVPKRVKRSRNGRLSFHESPCYSHPEFPESALQKSDRNIMACAMPGLPPELHIVYGNKWIEKRLSPLLQSSLPLFLIQTDYVPAFLLSPFEVCLYLFLMDYCIIKENYQIVKDEDLRSLLHIFRPSPMLKIKGLL